MFQHGLEGVLQVRDATKIKVLEYVTRRTSPIITTPASAKSLLRAVSNVCNNATDRRRLTLIKIIESAGKGGGGTFFVRHRRLQQNKSTALEVHRYRQGLRFQ